MSDKNNTSTPPDSSAATSEQQPKEEREEATTSDAETEAVTPKRGQRTRNPVVLLQHDYYEMYDDKNNRAGKRKMRAASSLKDSQADTNNENNSNSNSSQSKKRRTGKVERGKKSSKRTNSTPKTESTFRWVGSPIPPQKSTSGTKKTQLDSEDQTKATSKNNRNYYQKVELNVGNHPALVGIGDFVLVSSSDYEDKELKDKKKTNNVQNSVTAKSASVNTKSRSTAVRSMMTDYSDDEDEILNSTLESEEKMEVAMNSLDPYIGRVEEMWEETKSKRKDDEDEVFSNMKVRVRWFYKVRTFL